MMAAATLKEVYLASVDPNPFRLLATYPYNEDKLGILERSIAEVGLWEGVIVRPQGKRYEAAFGHHRLRAAERSGLDKIPVIVRDLSDLQMLQFMGRENLEEYNSDFLIMLETWEAAAVFAPSVRGTSKQPIELARLLGWTQGHGTHDQLNMTARACNAAYTLIGGGYLAREDLGSMTVYAALEIVERTQSRMEQLEKLGTQSKRPRKEIDDAKEQMGKGAKETARQLRDGQIAQRELRGQVDVNAYRHAKESHKVGPLLSVFAKGLADNLGKMLKDDATARKLQAINDVLGDVTLDEDKQLLARIDFELGEVGSRSVMWQRRMTLPANRVVNLSLAARKED
jgi:ParB-like nuclease domain